MKLTGAIVGVIPAEAGLSTAELVIHLDLLVLTCKMDSRFRGNDGSSWDAAMTTNYRLFMVSSV